MEIMHLVVICSCNANYIIIAVLITNIPSLSSFRAALMDAHRNGLFYTEHQSGDARNGGRNRRQSSFHVICARRSTPSGLRWETTQTGPSSWRSTSSASAKTTLTPRSSPTKSTRGTPKFDRRSQHGERFHAFPFHPP